MAPVTEVVIFSLKPNVSVSGVAGDTTAKAAWEYISNTTLEQPGAQRAYWGMEEENPSTLRLFVDWDSLEHHQDFAKTDVYKPLLKKIDEIADQVQGFHTTLTPHPPSAALSNTNSPVTELLHVNFPSDYSSTDKDKFEQNMKKFMSIIEQNCGDAMTASAGGWFIETDKHTTYFVAIGWQSIEAHHKVRAASYFQENVHLLRDAKGQVSRTVSHASLTEVQAGGPADAGRDVKQDVQGEILNPH